MSLESEADSSKNSDTIDSLPTENKKRKFTLRKQCFTEKYKELVLVNVYSKCFEASSIRSFDEEVLTKITSKWEAEDTQLARVALNRTRAIPKMQIFISNP